LSKICKPNERESIRKAVAGKKDLQNAKRSQSSRYPILENEVLDWINASRKDHYVVSTAMIKRKALQIRDQMTGDGAKDAFTGPRGTFKASNGWFAGFKGRMKMSFKSLKGTESTIPIDRIEKGREELIELLREYKIDDIYNADETGLFYQQLPTNFCFFSGSQCKEAKTQKNRLTLLLYCSCTGEKLRPLIIGKSRAPRTF
jgi:hypothetical protein